MTENFQLVWMGNGHGASKVSDGMINECLLSERMASLKFNMLNIMTNDE